ncbi:MAG: type II secretion system protein N [Proteobacteria bacterium]|nr:type II secretion system protein N [Pseudomonadota bacterium]
MITRARGLALLALVVLVVALVATFPARVAYRWVSSPLLAMSGIHGTVWNGSAREFSTNGVYLRELTWKIRPLNLLGGKAVYDVSGSPVSGFFDGEASVGIGGRLSLRNLSASVPLAMLEDASNIAGLRGNASVRIERLELVDGRAAALDGNVEVTGLHVPMLSRSSLGGYRAEFFTQQDGIVASIEDTDGVVDLAGSLRLDPDKSYTFLGQVGPKPGTPDELRQQLRYLGSADERGLRELRLEGSY